MTATLRHLPLRGLAVGTTELADRLGVSAMKLYRWAEALGIGKHPGSGGKVSWSEADQWMLALVAALAPWMEHDVSVRIAVEAASWGRRHGFIVAEHVRPLRVIYASEHLLHALTLSGVTTIIDLGAVDALLGPPEFTRDVPTGGLL